jgi:hypothetical protein
VQYDRFPSDLVVNQIVQPRRYITAPLSRVLHPGTTVGCKELQGLPLKPQTSLRNGLLRCVAEGGFSEISHAPISAGRIHKGTRSKNVVRA